MTALDPILTSPAPFGARRAPNRFVAQPMEGNDGEDGGRPSPRTLERYRALGRGAWGITVVEAVSVVEDCLARVNQLVLNERNLDAFKRLTAAYREGNPEGLLLFQITHSGRKGTGGTVPTALYPEGAPAGARLLSEDEVERIRDRFVKAASLAEAAGTDGIDFKLCHGYFGAELLRPANDRKDRWGGSFENRTRFLRESVPEIRSALRRRDFILGARLSLYEGIRGGCGTAAADELVEDLSEMRRVVSLMAELGMEYVNVSAGIPGDTSEITRPVPQGRWFYLHHIRYARVVSEALAAARKAGAAGSPAVIQSALSILKGDGPALAADCIRRGYADFAGFGRQIFADPETPAKLMRGEEPRWCAACSGCSKLMVKQVNDGCSLYDPYYRDLLKAQGGA